jgi:hypothetical protein
MLQIKKEALLTRCKYSLTFLFRKSKYKAYPVRKQKTQSIFLRSPKHFNIGKQKIYNLNYKTPTLFFKQTYPFFVTSVFNTNVLYNCLKKRIQISPTLKVNSLKITVQTTFKIMWLEI